MNLYQTLKALGATFQTDLERQTVNVSLPLSAFTITDRPAPLQPKDPLRNAIEGENYGNAQTRALLWLARGHNNMGQRWEAHQVPVNEASDILTKAGWVEFPEKDFIQIMATDIRLRINDRQQVSWVAVCLLGLGTHTTISAHTVQMICSARGWTFTASEKDVKMDKHVVPYINGTLPLWKVLEGLFNS